VVKEDNEDGHAADAIERGQAMFGLVTCGSRRHTD
jgi:hypothetical protein